MSTACIDAHDVETHKSFRLSLLCASFLIGKFTFCVDELWLMMVCRSCLYGAVLDKPKPATAVPAAGKAGKAAAGGAGANAQQGSSKARVVRTETSAAVLSDLVARWRAFKDDLRQVSF